MGRHELATRRRRWSVPMVAVVIPAAVLLTAGAAAHRSIASDEPLCCAEIVAATPMGQGPAAAGAPYNISPTPAALVASSRAARNVKYPLSVGVASEKGLQVKTIWIARAISAMFPEIHTIGGVRPDALKWHPQGLAIDVMIPNYQTAEGKALGDRIAAFAFDNADRFGLDHVIWRRVLYLRNSPPRLMANYGSDDANHYTHVHIATDGGGYPTGAETYFF